ncbi:unnamed protein product, partial [Porites evermanni]
MYPPKPLSTKVVMSFLTVLLALGATFGNGSILAVIARFKSFRTVPNTLLANLAVVDMLNIAINIPIYMIATILEARWFRGQSLAIMSSFFNRLFIILNLASLLALMADMYLAMAFDLKYFVWKSTYKAVVSSFIIWFSGTLIVVLFSIPLLLIDLGDVQVIEYRAKIYQQGKYYIAAFMALFIICSGILGFLTIQAIKRMKKKRAEMNLPVLADQGRLQSNIKTSKTIAITIAAYFISYLPAVVYAILGQQEESQTDSWFGFIAWYATYFSSAVNPFIYYYRTNRFRSALQQFLKDPFGKTDFKEKPKCRKREKKTDAEKHDGQENQRENETRISEEYHGERRKGLTIVSIQALQSHLCDHEQNGNTGIENHLQKRNNFAFISAGGGENSALRHEVQRKEEEKNVSNEVTLRRRSDGDIISKRK